MSRDEGFRNADVDVGLLDDPKVRQLVRSTRDEALVARCLVAYVATLTSSWGQGQRVALEDAAPLWMTGVSDLRDRLVDVGLIDPDGRIPERAWESWYGQAQQRKENLRERWRRANTARKGKADSKVTALSPRGYSGDPLRTVPDRFPSDPSVPVSRNGARTNEVDADVV